MREEVRKGHVRDRHLHRFGEAVVREVDVAVHDGHDVRNPERGKRRAALRGAEVAEVHAGYDLRRLREELRVLDREQRRDGRERELGLRLDLGLRRTVKNSGDVFLMPEARTGSRGRRRSGAGRIWSILAWLNSL